VQAESDRLDEAGPFEMRKATAGVPAFRDGHGERHIEPGVESKLERRRLLERQSLEGPKPAAPMSSIGIHQTAERQTMSAAMSNDSWRYALL
jgi:hypothetical protein